MQNSRPLVSKLIQFHGKQPYSLHVPGHKNGHLSHLPNEIKAALSFDYTELEGLDDLHAPTDSIKLAEDLLTSLHNTYKSYFLVNGSTVGNLAMIYATCEPNDYVIIQRNCHKSIFNAITLRGAKPIYLTSEWDSHTKTTVGVCPNLLKQTVEKYNNIKVVVLTSPNYYGVEVKHLQELIAYCHTKNIIVLIDEAHGAHFGTIEGIPPSALTYGADVVVQSAHKTLPAMTMGAFLHVNSKRINIEKIKLFLTMLQSSSPSYLIMASLDDARYYKATYHKHDFTYFMEQRDAFIRSLEKNNRLTVITTDDPLKIMIRHQRMSGFALQTAMARYHVYSELADNYQVLLVLPLLKEGVNYPFTRIAEAIQQAAEITGKSYYQHDAPVIVKPASSEPKYSVTEALAAPSSYVSFNEAIGRIAAETVTPYPPGIPLLLAGELITEEVIASLKQLCQQGAYFQSGKRIDENILCVMREG